MKRVVAASLIFALLAGSTSRASEESINKSPSIYFLMIDRFNNGSTSNDRGGLGETRLSSGFDPMEDDFFHGGDILGITQKLSYIKDLGFEAIWITPPVRQVAGGFGSASYHGYAGTDFTDIDPRFGTKNEFKKMVQTAHELGLKVILDIVVNHTADIIKYSDGDTNYEYLKEAPYRDKNGKSFTLSKALQSGFPALSAGKSFPKIPIQKPDARDRKAPAFLRDVTNYHNRGDSTFSGESSLYGDFYGLDDVFTEKPEVIEGWITLWSQWIKEYSIDGFRIDTYKHVNKEFWAQFIPAIKRAAKAVGKDDFLIYAEIYDSDPSNTSYYLREENAASILDFPFQSRVTRLASYGIGASELAEMFDQDDLYNHENFAPSQLGTFLGNHDMGRIGMFLIKSNPNLSDAALLERAELAHAMLFLLRGSPIVYYGDEKGLTGVPGDKAARQDLFPTQMSEWKVEKRIGSTPIGDRSAFDVSNPLEFHIAKLNQLRKKYSLLANGAQETLYAQQGIYVASRFSNQGELIIGFNGSDTDEEFEFKSKLTPTKELLAGELEILQVNGNSLQVKLPARSWFVLKAEGSWKSIKNSSLKLSKLDTGYAESTWHEFGANLNGSDYAEIKFQYRAGKGKWTNFASTNRKTFGSKRIPKDFYRAFLPGRELKKNANFEVRAIAELADGSDLVSNILKLKNTY